MSEYNNITRIKNIQNAKTQSVISENNSIKDISYNSKDIAINISRFVINHNRHPLHYSMHSAHSHTYYELFYLIEGDCTITLDDKLFMLSAGNLMFIPANAVHRTSYIGETTPERIYVEFSANYIETIIKDLGKNWTDKNLWSHILFINEEDRPLINAIFKEIQDEYNIIDHYSDCCIKQLFQMLIIKLIRLDKSTDRFSRSTPHHSDNIKTDMIYAAKYIAENFKNDITLNDVATQLRLNPAYFSNKFKKFYGIGFSEYLRNVRINHAEWYLLETNLSLSDISDECGFNNPNYFGDTFRKVNGISPSEFRRNNKPKKIIK